MLEARKYQTPLLLVIFLRSLKSGCLIIVFHFLLAPDIVQISEETPLKKNSKPFRESLENRENLKTDPTPHQEALEEEECPLKPKTVKLKKMKNGKLLFVEGKTTTRESQQEAYCRSLIEFVGSDPETESQTLRGYLDNGDGPEILNVEDECNFGGKSDFLGGSSKPKDREFLTYLQEADIECVEVVCKRTSRLLEDHQDSFNDCTTERMEHKIGSAVNDSRYPSCQDFEEGSFSKDIGGIEMSDSPRRTSEIVDKIGKLQSKQGTESCTKSFGLSSDDACNKSDKDSANIGTKMPSCCHQGRKSDQNVFSHFNIVSLDDNVTVDEYVLCERSNSRGYGTKANQPLKESTRSTKDKVFNPPKYSSQVLENRECLPVKEDGNASVTAVPYDDNSADDFQDDSFKNTQVAPVPVTQKPSKKRNAANKPNQKTENREARRGNRWKQPPTDWHCSACTFINDRQLLECSICFTPRAKIDETTSTVDDNPLSIKSISGQGRDDVYISDKMDLYGTGVDCMDTSSTCVNSGKISGIVKHESSQISFGSAQMTSPISTGQTVEPHATGKAIVHNLSSESMITPLCDSKSDIKSTIRKAKSTDNDSVYSQVAESGLPPWSCAACTFLNLSEMIECSMCLTPKRRSRRVSAKKSLLTVETEKEASASKTTSSDRRRWKRAKNVEDQNPREMDEGLTAEPLGLSRETQSSSHTQYGHEVLREEISEEVKSNPRKRLRLNEVEGENGICDVSYDSEVLCSDSTIKCSYALSSSAAPYELMATTPPDGKGIDVASPVDSVLSSDQEELQLRTDHGVRCCKIGNNDLEMDCEQLDVSDHLATEQCSGVSSTVSSEGNVGGHLPSSKNSEIDEVMEDLEELKAAAEKFFSSEWEDDERWWEEESSFEISSSASSSETASSSPTVTSPGFTKCSDFCSVTELKKKLETDAKQLNETQPKAAQKPRYAKGNPKNTEAAPLANEYNSRPELDPVIEEEEEDEKDAPPEAMKLKFCLSLYTERLYLYTQVSHLLVCFPFSASL